LAAGTAWVAVAALASACKPKAGDHCSAGSAACLTPSSGLFCQNGVYLAVDCKGAGGCSQSGAMARCDIGDDMPGAACADWQEGQFCTVDGVAAAACKGGKVDVVECAHGCTTGDDKVRCEPKPKGTQAGDPCTPFLQDVCDADGAAWLTCQDHKFVVAERCHGKLACTMQGNVVACDTSFGVEGEPCASGSRCDAASKSVLACNDGKLAVARACKGPEGCTQGRDYFPGCDNSLADEGDPCDDGQHACSTSLHAILVCKGSKLVTDRVCVSGTSCAWKGRAPACARATP
jgi:hypothetical protein